MAIKRIVDTVNLRKQIEKFTEEKATPSAYCKNNKKENPEKKLQKHFSECLSIEHDVMREISINALSRLPGSGEEKWEIDETLLIPTTMGAFYATGELKFHGKDMVETRDYVGEVKEDIKRMVDVARSYSDVTMAFSLFITCDEKEIDEVSAYANQFGDIVTVIKVSVNEDGYCAIMTAVVPKAGHVMYAFYSHWAERLSYLQTTKQIQDNYYPRKWNR